MASDKFVSRGGDKLQAALNKFPVNVKDRVVLDIGSSTGGFVDCLLQNGAAKVYAVDTAYGELSWKLRQDPRVVVMERTNILHLNSMPENVDLVTIDAGWTKLELILPVVKKFLKEEGLIIALLKPQYESDKQDLDHGLVKEERLDQIKSFVEYKIKDLGFTVERDMRSPILGGGGNVEYLLLIHI